MSQIFASKTNRAFFQTVFTVIIALTALFFLSTRIFQISDLYLSVLAHKIIDACGCADMTQFLSMHPIIFGAVILLGAGIGIFIFYSLYKLVKLNSLTKKYIAYYLSSASIGHSAKLKAAVKSLGLDNARFIEIDKQNPVVFCFGFWQPKICISQSLVGMLSMNELKAVLLHEARHMSAYEPLKIFIAKYFRDVFFFLPGLKNSVKKYIILSELAADEHASDSAARRCGLASAILKISRKEEILQMENGSSLSYFSSAIEERANRLSDDVYAPKFKFLDKNLVFGSVGLILVSVMVFLTFSDSTKAFEMYNGDSCISMDNLKSNSACGFMVHESASGVKNGNSNRIDVDIFSQNSVCKIN